MSKFHLVKITPRWPVALGLALVLAACGGVEPDDGSGGSSGSGGSATGGGNDGAGGTSDGGSGAASGGSGAVDVQPFRRRIQAHGDMACVIEQSGEVLCWTRSTTGRPLDGTFVEVSVNGIVGTSQLVCGVRTDGTISCAGAGSPGSDNIKDGIPGHTDFVHVGVTVDPAACGVRAGGEVACWGVGGIEGTAPATGEFDALANGLGHICGLAVGKLPVCWGFFDSSYVAPTRADRIDGNWNAWCGLDGDLILCERENDLPVGWTSIPGATQIGHGGGSGCVLDAQGALTCWSALGTLRTNLPEESARFVEVAVGEYFACGIASTGLVRCWGELDDGREAIVPREIRVF